MNTTRFILLFVFVAGLNLAAGRAAAHHSVTEYDMTATTSVKGTVTKFEWTNPHAYIHIEAKDDKGAVVEWTAEARQPRHALSRQLEAGHSQTGRRNHHLRQSRQGRKIIYASR